MTLSHPQFDDMAFDDASSMPVKQDIQRPTKRRSNNRDAINVPFGDISIQIDHMVNQPENYKLMVSLPGEHSPILEITSVDGKWTKPVMEFSGCAVETGKFDKDLSKTLFPEGIIVAQSDKAEKNAKTTQMVLDYRGTHFAVTSRAEGSDYMTMIERTRDGEKTSIRFAAADQNPHVTYSKLAL